jgi:hypothetical protein
MSLHIMETPMRFALITACLLISAAEPADARSVSPSAAKTYRTSWGKAGISLAQYRADAVACGQHASGMDLDGSDPARALVVASRRMESEPNATPMAVQDPRQAPGAGMDPLAMAGSAPSAMQMAAPERQIAKAGDIMKVELERCLAGFGYREFRLTADQRRKLNKLAVGSEARHAYLHGLASDPEILEQQRVK